MFHKRLLKEFRENQKLTAGMTAAQWTAFLSNVILVFSLSRFIGNLLENRRESGMYFTLFVTWLIVIPIRVAANSLHQKL